MLTPKKIVTEEVKYVKTQKLENGICPEDEALHNLWIFRNGTLDETISEGKILLNCSSSNNGVL